MSRSRFALTPNPATYNLWRRLGWRALTVLGVSALATVVGVAFRGVVNPPTTAFMQQRLMYLRTHGLPHAHLDYRWVNYREMAPVVHLAVVASEDQDFPYNNGFDWAAMEQALRHNRLSRHLHGGSTITQQTAKNLYLWGARSYLRKTVEAYFTVLINMEWPKARILEMYLNVAQFGRNIFGVDAASRHLFGKTPAELTPGEAALLAAALPAPDRYNLTDPSGYLQQRQHWILEQMRNLGGAYLDGIEAAAHH